MHPPLPLLLFVVVATLVFIASSEGKNGASPSALDDKPRTSFPVHTFTVNLDLPPQQRWKHVVPHYRQPINRTFEFVSGIIPAVIRQEVMEAIEELGGALEFFLGTYGLEIEGMADVVGIPSGDIALINVLYEMVSMCTSIVAETPDGHILHSRNLDFGLGTEFTTLLQNLTVQVEFQKGGRTLYSGTTYAAYVGLLTGMSPGRFGVSLNLRHSCDILGNMKELFSNPKARVVSFFLRQVLESEQSYADALRRLTREPLISESYIILSGVSSGQGAVITRNRRTTDNLWTLGGPKKQWYLIQTNHDHWRPSPPGDYRSVVGELALNAIGQENISLDSLYRVLSAKPLLNAQTTYTTLMAPYNATFSTNKRVCPPPCSLH